MVTNILLLLFVCMYVCLSVFDLFFPHLLFSIGDSQVSIVWVDLAPGGSYVTAVLQAAVAREDVHCRIIILIIVSKFVPDVLLNL
jgi:hypothetical protein